MSEAPRPTLIRASRIVEILSAACVLAIAVAGFIAVPELVSGWRFVMPGTTDAALTPTFFPRLAFILLGVTALGVMMTSPVRREELPIVTMTGEDWRRFGGALALVVLYVMGARLFGFLPASIAFVASLALYSGYRNLLVIGLASVLAPLMVLLAFRYGLRVLLPAGTIY